VAFGKYAIKKRVSMKNGVFITVFCLMNGMVEQEENSIDDTIDNTHNDNHDNEEKE
jgi:hypothetical protein